MKILVISHEYPPIGGGGATACANLTKNFEKSGNEVIVITTDLNGIESSLNDGCSTIYKIKSKRSSIDHSSFSEMFSFLIFASKKVKKLMKEGGGFDVVLINFGIPSGPLGYHMKKKYSIPYVVRVGGGDIPGTQKRFNFVYKFISPFLKLIWKNADYVILNSQGLKDRALKFYDSNNLVVINNGISLQDFEIRKSMSSVDTFKIVTTARIVERKGVQHVIEALKKLKDKGNNKIEYTIVGDGPYREIIEEMIDKYNLKDQVSITGMVAHKDVLQYLSNSHLFVLMSHWEGMPNVVLEAMASSLPIVMSNCEGSDELISGNGYIIQLNEFAEEELCNRLESLMNDPELMSKLAKKSLSHVKEKFLWQISAQKYIDLFERMENKI